MAGEDTEEGQQLNAERRDAIEPPIEPGRFDAIIVSTGLPEVLIAR